jgi:hypothetical protein
VIDVGAICQEHIGNGASVFVPAECLERDSLSKDKFRGGLLGSFAIGLTFLWTVDAAEADTFGAVVVQDFNGVAVEATDNGVGELGERGLGEKKEDETCQ